MQANQMSFARRGTARRKTGYTLVEVLCAIAVATMAASALFMGFDNGFAIQRTAREDLRATQILIQKTEAIRLMSWQTVTNHANGWSFPDCFSPQGTNPGTLYYGTISISIPTNMPVAYQTNVRLVTITLNWTNFVGTQLQPHSRQMETLSAKYGMQNFLQ